MEASIELFGNVAVLVMPSSSLDASNADEFKRDVTPVMSANPRLVFDMSSLQFVDSSGLGAILACLRQQNSTGGDLKLCGIRKPVRALFELVRMHRVFDIYNTREEAVGSFAN